MKIKVLEEKLRGSDPETGQRYNLEKDDVLTVPDAVGERWVNAGLAEDVAGKVVTGERSTTSQRINPQSLSIKTSMTTAKKKGK